MESKQVSHSGIRREWNGGLFKEDFGHRVETQQLIFPESHEWGGVWVGVWVCAHTCVRIGPWTSLPFIDNRNKDL